MQSQTITRAVWWERFRASLTTREFWFNLLLAVLIFIAPTNLFYKFWESGSFVHGLQVDYLIGKFYLSQIPLFGILGLWLSEPNTLNVFLKHFENSRVKIGIALFLALGLRQFFTPEPLVSVWHWLTFLSIGLFGFFVHINKHRLQLRILALALAATIVFQSIVGIAQFQLHRELLGFAFLGEPTLSQSIGIATTTISGAEHIQPYGTTAHPNVLAGYLAIYSLLLINISKNRKFAMPAVGLAICAIALTTSMSAVLALVLGLGLPLPTQRNISRNAKSLFIAILILVPITIAAASQYAPKNTSLVRREYLQQSGIGIFFANPIWGTGLQTATRYVEEFSPASEVVRFTQPPHHVGILALAETGLLGVGLIAVLLRSKLNPNFLVLAPILALDHYAWTLVPGMLLVSMCILLTCYD